MASLADDLCAEVRRQCEQAEWYKRLWIQAQDDLSKKDDLIAALRAQLNLNSDQLERR